MLRVLRGSWPGKEVPGGLLLAALCCGEEQLMVWCMSVEALIKLPASSSHLVVREEGR